MNTLMQILICVLCDIVIGVIGSLIAARVDRYLQRRKRKKSPPEDG